MKMFRRLGRNVRDAFLSVIRNFSLSIASISSITITLIVVGLAIIISYNVNNFTEIIKRDVTLVMFLQEDITDDDISLLEESIKEHNNVLSYEFYSKEQVAEDMMGESEVYESIMSEWDSETNPLSDEFLIKVRDVSIIDDTAAYFDENENIKLLKYGEGVVNNLLDTFDVVENIAYIVVIGLILVTAFLISNTIKLTIFSRQTEISIMRLVGASNLSIRVPFMIEGLVLGVIGSIIPMALIIYGYSFIYDYYGGQLFSPIIKLVQPEPFIYFVALISLGLAILVGMLGSFRAVRRYLKI